MMKITIILTLSCVPLCWSLPCQNFLEYPFTYPLADFSYSNPGCQHKDPYPKTQIDWSSRPEVFESVWSISRYVYLSHVNRNTIWYGSQLLADHSSDWWCQHEMNQSWWLLRLNTITCFKYLSWITIQQRLLRCRYNGRK